MASHPPPLSSPVIQIVKRGEGKEEFNTEDFKKLIKDYCRETYVQYPVVSIIGLQSSGKSTLMNNLFRTDFRMMDQSGGWKATTEGIWAAVCQHPRAIVLDVEGADGDEHQDDAGFENQTALFALEISDVILFNIKSDHIHLMHAGSKPLLHTIFQESRFRHKTKFVVAVRDCDETPESVLRRQVLEKLDEVLVGSNKVYFETSVQQFPHFKHNLEAFKQKCQYIIADSEFFKKAQNNWPVEEFAIVAEKLWKSTMENEILDMPSYWEVVSLQRCEAVMKQKLRSLESQEVYQSLINGNEETDLVTFHAKLDGILQSILHEYSEDTKYLHQEHANKVRDKIKIRIIENLKEAFKQALKTFTSEFLNDRAGKEIEAAMNANLFEDMPETVMKYSRIFNKETKDLYLYHDIVKECQQEVETTLVDLTKAIRDKAVAWFVGKWGFRIFLAQVGLSL